MNKNDKIVELVKAVLNGKTVQYSNFGSTWVNSNLQKEQNLFVLVDCIVLKPDNFRIKPETKTITVRSCLTRACTACTLVFDNYGTTEADVEACGAFKQWLGPEPRTYEVEV
jgi:hypothetical protein